MRSLDEIERILDNLLTLGDRLKDLPVSEMNEALRETVAAMAGQAAHTERAEREARAEFLDARRDVLDMRDERRWRMRVTLHERMALSLERKLVYVRGQREHVNRALETHALKRVKQLASIDLRDSKTPHTERDRFSRLPHFAQTMSVADVDLTTVASAGPSLTSFASDVMQSTMADFTAAMRDGGYNVSTTTANYYLTMFAVEKFKEQKIGGIQFGAIFDKAVGLVNTTVKFQQQARDKYMANISLLDTPLKDYYKAAGLPPNSPAGQAFKTNVIRAFAHYTDNLIDVSHDDLIKLNRVAGQVRGNLNPLTFEDLTTLNTVSKLSGLQSDEVASIYGKLQRLGETGESFDELYRTVERDAALYGLPARAVFDQLNTGMVDMAMEYNVGFLTDDFIRAAARLKTVRLNVEDIQKLLGKFPSERRHELYQELSFLNPAFRNLNYHELMFAQFKGDVEEMVATVLPALRSEVSQYFKRHEGEVIITAFGKLQLGPLADVLMGGDREKMRNALLQLYKETELEERLARTNADLLATYHGLDVTDRQGLAAVLVNQTDEELLRYRTREELLGLLHRDAANQEQSAKSSEQRVKEGQSLQELTRVVQQNINASKIATEDNLAFMTSFLSADEVRGRYRELGVTMAATANMAGGYAKEFLKVATYMEALDLTAGQALAMRAGGIMNVEGVTDILRGQAILTVDSIDFIKAATSGDMKEVQRVLDKFQMDVESYTGTKPAPDRPVTTSFKPEGFAGDGGFPSPSLDFRTHVTTTQPGTTSAYADALTRPYTQMTEAPFAGLGGTTFSAPQTGSAPSAPSSVSSTYYRSPTWWNQPVSLTSTVTAGPNVVYPQLRQMPKGGIMYTLAPTYTDPVTNTVFHHVEPKDVTPQIRERLDFMHGITHGYTGPVPALPDMQVSTPPPRQSPVDATPNVWWNFNQPVPQGYGWAGDAYRAQQTVVPDQPTVQPRTVTPTATPYMPGARDTTAGLKGKQLVQNPEFMAAVKSVSAHIGVQPYDLLRVMYNESIGINAQARNRTTKATGLIQFMPSTAKGLGTTVDTLYRMTPLEQMVYVQKYYQPYRGRMHDYHGLYLATFYPLALRKDHTFVFGSEKSDSYARKVAAQNPAISQGKPYITRREFNAYIDRSKKPPTFRRGGPVHRARRAARHEPEITWETQYEYEIRGQVAHRGLVSGTVDAAEFLEATGLSERFAESR